MPICLIAIAAALTFAGETRGTTAPARTPAAPGGSRTTTVVRADPRTGRLVRRVAVPSKRAPSRTVRSRSVSPQPAPTEGAKNLRQAVDESARRHGVDPALVHSVISVESNYNPYAISHRGAEGVMQLMPSTARRLGVANSFDWRQNIEAGVRYLKSLQQRFQDDRLALAAYNAGPEAVARHGWIPPYRETQNYVYQVGRRYGELRRSATAPAPVAGPVAPPVEAEHRTLVTTVDEEGKLVLRTR